MNHSEFWQELKANVPEPDWQRIESGLTGQGIPDLNGCYFGVEAWVELKVLNRGLKLHDLTPFQVSWHIRRTHAGGRTFFAVRIQKPGVDKLVIWPGSAARELKDRGLRAESLALASLSAPIDWSIVRNLFFGDTDGFRRQAWR